MGWLNAPQDDREGKSRVEDFGIEHPICKLPETDTLLVMHFRKAGPFLNVGNGPYAVTWQEIESYSRMQNISLTEWESDQISAMSQLYCSYLNIGKKPCKPPYEREFDESDRRALNKSFDDIFEKENAALAKLKKQT